MGSSAFEAWLSESGRLDAEQRFQALLALTDAEARAAAAPTPTDVRSASVDSPGADTTRDDATLLGKIGHSRVESFGCPHCASDDVRPWGRAGGKPRFRCAGCRRTFNPLTGTPLAGLHYQDRWRDQAEALIAGESLAKAAARCNIAYSTAYRWRHRFLGALNLDKPQQLSGIVEADETFVRESFKGKRGLMPRPARPRGGRAGKRGLSGEQIPVIVARDRSRATFDAVLRGLDTASMTAALGGVIGRGADLCCDGGMAIAAFGRRAGVRLHILPAPGLPKPNAPDFHINNVNVYHGRLKEWRRRFHGVATHNLSNYLSWRRTIEALSPDSSPDAWIMGAMGLGPYQQGLK